MLKIKLIISFVISLLIFFAIFVPASIAGEKTAEPSASIQLYGSCRITNKTNSSMYFLKSLVLKDFFQKHNSPLAEKSKSFILYCQKYNLDCYILPSIASVESYYGKRYIFAYNNPFGWKGGYYKFESLEDAIDTVAKKLKYNYVEKGADNLKLIGKYYAKDPNWWIKTSKIKSQLINMEKKYYLLLDKTLVE